MTRVPLRMSPRSRGHAGALRAETGSFLIEVMVTAVILLIVSAGVLSMLDNAGARSAEQRARAVAGNLAQNEQERLRALPLEELSNNHSESTETVDTFEFQIESRAEWVTDGAGEASCAVSGATADYLRITTTVDSPSLRGRAPTKLDSIVSPPARAFGPTQGSLAVQVNDAGGNPVEGLAVNVDGPATVSGVTNDTGCVLWGYLPAGNGYVITFSRVGWLDGSGVSNISRTESVTPEVPRTAGFVYDRGGALRTRFETVPASGGVAKTTAPGTATLSHQGPPSSATAYPVSAGQLTTPLLFPFTTEWSLWADSCAAARPTSPLLRKVLPGQTVDTPTIVLPSLDVKVVGSTGAALSGARVVVISACGTRYERLTGATGRLADPGFPWGAANVCADATIAGVKRRLAQVLTNATLPGQDKTITLTTTSVLGACP